MFEIVMAQMMAMFAEGKKAKAAAAADAVAVKRQDAMAGAQ